MQIRKRSLGFTKINDANRKRNADWRKKTAQRSSRRRTQAAKSISANQIGHSLFSIKSNATKAITGHILQYAGRGQVGSIVNRLI
ncbi:MAG: hypothetical protein COB90_03335 [Hyphomicrobiales bacterium]|nr:MAG: hypothetical protein COB90_03335 [Hyphomicrobiales bacterium]